MGHLVKQDLDLLWGEQTGEEEITVAVELLDLCLREFHNVSSLHSDNPAEVLV